MKHIKKINLIKESFDDDVKYNLAHLVDDGFTITTEILDDSLNLIRIWLAKNKNDEFSYENSIDYKYNDIQVEVIRLIEDLSDDFNFEHIYTIGKSKESEYSWKRNLWTLFDICVTMIDTGTIKCFVLIATKK